MIPNASSIETPDMAHVLGLTTAMLTAGGDAAISARAKKVDGGRDVLTVFHSKTFT